MRRRTRALLVGIVLVVIAAAISGALVATGLGGGDTTRPSGAETVLRIQPVDEEVSCGAGPAAVYIYLDDLEARPSPRQADASYGVAAFEFPLRYDPQIVRIGQPINVQANPGLDVEDADGDGVARSFLLLSDIDDFAGWAMLGAASIVPSSQRPEDNLEEGLDPVAKGEPLLLMTIRFTPVGHGSTAIAFGAAESGLPSTFREAGLADPSGKLYGPVVLKGASLTVAGGDCPEPPSATPRPTIRPTATPYVPPTIAIPTPVLVTPTPAIQGGRADCPQDWAAYRDPDGHFSLCYPAEWRAITAAPGAGLGRTIELFAEGVSLTVYWEKSSAFYEGVVGDRCHAVSHWENLGEVNLTIAGRSVVACTGYETLRAPDAPPLRSTFAEFSVEPDPGYMVLFLTEAEAPGYGRDRDLASLVLRSLRLRE